MTTNTTPSGADALQAKPPGIDALQCVIASMRDTAHFSDEEGELTNDLRTLRDWALARAALTAAEAQASGRAAPSDEHLIETGCYQTVIDRHSQPATRAEPVAYLDLGVGGYMDVGTDLTDEQLAALPKGRHMLGIIGTYGVDGYTATPVAAQVPAASIKRDAEFDQFLTDVMTAAGLVTHGRRCKALGERLGAWCMKYRLQAPAANGDRAIDAALAKATGQEGGAA